MTVAQQAAFPAEIKIVCCCGSDAYGQRRGEGIVEILPVPFTLAFNEHPEAFLADAEGGRNSYKHQTDKTVKTGVEIYVGGMLHFDDE